MTAFTPMAPLGTLAMNVTTSSSTLTVPSKISTVRIYNSGSITAFIEIGTTAIVPVAGGASGSMPLAAGAGSIPLLLEKGYATSISAITASGTTTLFVTPGFGDTVG